MKLAVVILTGGREGHQALLAGTSLTSKVLLPVAGKPMAQWVMEAVAGLSPTPRLYVSAQDPAILALPTPLPFTALPVASGAVASLLGALACLDPEQTDAVVFISGDHPLLTREMIAYFIAEAQRRDLTMGVAVVERQRVRQRYPQSQRSYIHLKRGAYSGGNLIYIDKRRFDADPRLLELVDGNRKKPWKSLLSLEPWLVVRALLRQMTIHELAQHFSRHAHCPTGVIEMPWAECCMDVDKPSDKTMAEAILGERRLWRVMAEPIARDLSREELREALTAQPVVAS